MDEWLNIGKPYVCINSIDKIQEDWKYKNNQMKLIKISECFLLKASGIKTYMRILHVQNKLTRLVSNTRSIEDHLRPHGSF